MSPEMNGCFSLSSGYEKINEHLHSAEVFNKLALFPFFISDNDKLLFISEKLLELVRKVTFFFFTRLCISYFRSIPKELITRIVLLHIC